MMLLGCGLFTDRKEAAESGGEAKLVVAGTPPAVAVPTSVVPEPSPSIGSPAPVGSETPPSSVAPLSIGYDGPRSLEQGIFDSPVIARVRLDSATSSVVSETILDGSTKYIPILEFSFSVLEYLKGSGSSNIVAYWAAAPLFDTRREAEAALPAIAAARDTRWDDHEATVFLQHPDTAFLSTKQPDRYYLSWGGSWSIPDDGYSIASIHNKLWLPADRAVGTTPQPSGDQQRFLLDVPPATGTAATITLGEMKARIAAVAAKLDASDGSEEYRECVQLTYRYEQEERHYRAMYPSRTGSNVAGDPPPDHEFSSGLAAGEPLYEDDLGFGPTADKRTTFWLNGGESNLFTVVYGASVPYDSTGDGVNDIVNFSRQVVSARPIPKGVYRFDFNIRSHFFGLCDGYTTRYEWTVAVNAPDGVLHEAFFDPVTVGNAVAADSENGTLKPALFTGTNGATTTIERISWEASTVSIELSPHTGVASHAVDFIALDGSVSLSLNVADATVDAASDTLSWPVASQPWRSRDKLMLRIREASR